MKQSMKKAALVLMLALAVLLVPQWSNTALAVTTPSDITTGSDLPPAPPLPTPPAEGELRSPPCPLRRRNFWGFLACAGTSNPNRRFAG